MCDNCVKYGDPDTGEPYIPVDAACCEHAAIVEIPF